MIIDEKDLFKILKKRGQVTRYKDLRNRLNMMHPFRIARLLVLLMRQDKIVMGTTGGDWYIIIRVKGDMFEGINYG